MIDLFSWPAPNGHKAHIMVEELGIAYRIIPIDITSGAQHEASYRAINPNGKIPAIVDHDPPGGGEPVTVFETGAILLYLAEREGRFLPADLRQRSEVIQWLFWQVGGLGPMMGQAQHFFRYASEVVPYGVTRYQNETRRLLKVMDDRLERRHYLCERYSIADMACFPWIRIHKMTGVALSDFPHVEAWYGRVRSRPAVGRAMDLLRDRWVDVTKSAEAKRNLFRAPDLKMEDSPRVVDAFVDLRSPYSYLALNSARALAHRTGTTFEWWPFITDFRSAYGGEVEQRSPRDVAKLKYLYMDCRRLAERQGLVIRSTTKLWDATLASQAMLFARERGRLWEFCDPLLAAFWRREFDLESRDQVEAVLVRVGLNAADWQGYLASRAQSELEAATQRAEGLGVFGAPTFVYKDELFWGGDRLELLAVAIEGARRAPDICDLT